MTVLLTVLKVLGILVSAAAILVRTLTKAQRRKLATGSQLARRFSIVLSERWAVRWIVAGVVVALLSQIAESLTSQIQLQKAKQKEATQRQNDKRLLSEIRDEAELQRKNLQFIQRNVGRYDMLHLAVEFQFDMEKCPALARLAQESSVIISNRLHERPDPEFSCNVVGVVIPDTNQPTLIFLSMPDPRTHIPLKEVLSSRYLSDCVTNRDFGDVYKALISPVVGFYAFSAHKRTDSTHDADFSVVVTNPIHPPIFCLLRGHKVAITYDFDLLAAQPHRDFRMDSIVDFSQATIWVGLTNFPTTVQATPTKAIISSEKAMVTVTNFTLRTSLLASVVEIDPSFVGQYESLIRARKIFENNVSLYTATLPGFQDFQQDFWFKKIMTSSDSTTPSYFADLVEDENPLFNAHYTVYTDSKNQAGIQSAEAVRP